MAYVIAEPCIGTKDTACVDVCPVDCIHPRKDEADFEAETQLYISPVECIDCGACVPVCPVTAIFALEDLPEKWLTSRRSTRIGTPTRKPSVIEQRAPPRRGFSFGYSFLARRVFLFDCTRRA
jgi:NAD-dependent dihydropyrimidine dehydrogenase PreA subunit